MGDLSEAVSVPVRTLYRLRDRGIFTIALRLNAKRVYYDLPVCVRAIRRYLREGVLE
jgi:hypothetical protein